MSDLSMKQEDHPAHGVPTATYHYSGDSIDNSVDISNEGEGPYSLGQAMQSAKAEQDRDEKIAGTRFHDSGVRVPRRQRGLNDRNLDRPASISPMISGPSSSWK